MKNYNKTKIACYLGFITQAIAANFTPLLFLKFHNDFNIPLGNIALIPMLFFFTQLLVDLFCVKFVDKIGYRKSIVSSEIFSALGFIELTFLPSLLPSPFIGIAISVITYAIGSGLIEVLCSPIMEACPFENKEATMSLLHSFYCWGSVGTILFSTIFFAIFGIDNYRVLIMLLTIVPIINIYNFATCPIEHLVSEGEGLSAKSLFKMPMFLIAIVLMICSGASELSMSQWASVFAESALGLSKAIGDLLGPCLFAVAMGISRVLYGNMKETIKLKQFMIGSGILCVICYVLVSLSSNPVLGLIGCITCGFSVGIMWPGTLSISSKTFPTGGTAMFAILAMAGDLGGSIGPAIVGKVAENANGNILVGMRVGLIFPIILVIGLLLFKKNKKI